MYCVIFSGEIFYVTVVLCINIALLSLIEYLYIKQL